MSTEQLNTMRNGVLFHNSIPLIVFLLGFITTVINYFKSSEIKKEIRNKNKPAERSKVISTEINYLSSLTVFLLLIILLNMNRVWMYYYVLAFPFAAITGGWMISYWIKNMSNFLLLKKYKLYFPEVKSNYFWLIASFIIFILTWTLSPRLEKRLDYYKEAMNKPIEKRKAYYLWKDGFLPTPVNQAVKTLFWHDERIIGESYSSISYYLWHVSRELDVVDSLANEIKLRTNKEDNIFGDSGTIPLLALLTNRNIAANEIDTNLERYRSGNANPKKLIQAIDIPSTKLILLRDAFGVASLAEIQNLVNTKYKFVKQFQSETGITLKLYERIPS